MAIPLIKCSIVALGATDNASPGGYLNKPAELINTIDPFDARSSGRLWWTRLKKPFISDSITSLHNFESISDIYFWGILKPAALTTVLMPLWSLLILAIQSLTESSSVKFSWTAATPLCASSIFFASSEFELYD